MGFGSVGGMGYDPNVVNGALQQLGGAPLSGGTTVPAPSWGGAPSQVAGPVQSAASTPIAQGVAPRQQQAPVAPRNGGGGGLLGFVGAPPSYAKDAGPNPHLQKVYNRQYDDQQYQAQKKQAIAKAVISFYTGGAASAAGGAGGAAGGGVLKGILG